MYVLSRKRPLQAVCKMLQQLQQHTANKAGSRGYHEMEHNSEKLHSLNKRTSNYQMHIPHVQDLIISTNISRTSAQQ